MSNIKIFRANRGEGKTQWLIDRINESEGNLYYVGGTFAFNRVKRHYEAVYNKVCPLKLARWTDIMMTTNNCYFTDELIDDMTNAANYKSHIIEGGDPWYITMSQEDFVN
jgi:hypothetical protein